MSITSVSYLVFVGISLIVYWNISARYQWWVLLADSLFFYFINAEPYTFIYLLVSVISVYMATGYFEKNSNGRGRKVILFFTILLNIGMLAVLKYTNLAIGTVNHLMETNFSSVTWLSPLAISYYTLQIVAYLLDCYWEVEKREKNPLKLLLYTSYFPLMISGPINRHNNLAPQLFEKHEFEYSRVVSGIRRVAWGIAKKIIVADRLSMVVGYMFNRPEIYSGIWTLIAAVTFAVELYFDFSGCMDIVIGISKCYGIILEENFKAPFMSRTIQEIWQRWHITLGGWFKSYIMYPILKSSVFVQLGERCKNKFGKSGKKIPSYIAMLVVWILIGLWHGSSWKYVVGEGLWFWAVIVLGQILEPVSKNIKKIMHINEKNVIWIAFQRCRTIILFSIGMIFFNASGLKASFYMLSRLFVHSGIRVPLESLYSGVWNSFGGKKALLAIIIIVIVQIYADAKTYKDKNAQESLIKLPSIIRWMLYIVLIYMIILEGVFGKNSFIYFGF